MYAPGELHKQSEKLAAWQDPPLVLLTVTTWWPLSARLAMAFLHQGFRVAAASPQKHPLRFVQGIDRHHFYGGSRSLETLRRALEHVSPDLVVPCDDGAVWQLQAIHLRYPALSPLLERSLGPPENFPILRGRVALLRVAQELGLRVPSTCTLTSPSGLSRAATSYPAVLKLDGSYGGSGVQIVSSREQAETAFHTLNLPLSRFTAYKRLLVDQNPIPLWSLQEHEPPSVSIQQFIHGRPANMMFACWQGRILGSVMVEVLSAQGPTGASTIVRLIDNPEMRAAAEALAQRLHLSGFHGLDFILEHHTNDAWLIEMNPRPTQLGHLRLPHQGDLVGALCACILGRPNPATDDPIRGDTVAFFPQAAALSPGTALLEQSYHDIPTGQPELHRQLLRGHWPHRRLLARLYHLFRPMTQPKEERFQPR